MRNFQEKKKFRQIAQSRPILVFLAILVLVFAWGVFGFTGKMIETVKNKQMAEAKIAELQKEKDKLSAEIAQLKTDQGVEASIREKFGLAKEGEGEIVIVDDKTPLTNTISSPNNGFWGFLKNWFKI